MSVQDAVPPGFRRDLTECPVCRTIENVVAVPAIYDSARATEKTLAKAEGALNDDDSSTATKDAARKTLALTPPAAVRSS